MNEKMTFPKAIRELTEKRNELNPDADSTWTDFSAAVFEEGALPVKIKRLIAVCVAHVTQCPYSIRTQTREALKAGASQEEIMEAIWIAAAGKASGAYSHAGISRMQMDINDGVLEDDGTLYAVSDAEMAQKKAKLAPSIIDKWRKFSNQVFKANLLDEKTKQLIALGISHVTQCAYCIKGHTKMASVKGATNEEMMEAIWVAAEMRGNSAYAQSLAAMEEMLALEN